MAYTSTMFLAKISIGFFLLRVTVERVHIWIIRTAMAITALTGVIFFFVTVLQCSPVSFFWSKAVGGKGTCLDIEVIIGLTYFYSAVSALCDLTFGILPIFMLWNLNMSRRTKIALAPILSMACIASAGIIVRMAYVKDFKDPDFLCTCSVAQSPFESKFALTQGQTQPSILPSGLTLRRDWLSPPGLSPVCGHFSVSSRRSSRHMASAPGINREQTTRAEVSSQKHYGQGVRRARSEEGKIKEGRGVFLRRKVLLANTETSKWSQRKLLLM